MTPAQSANEPESPNYFILWQEKGLLNARERLEAFFQPETFQEFGLHAQHACTRFGMDKKTLPCDGVVCGTGLVEGRPVAAYAQEFTVSGGSLGRIHSKKICDLTYPARFFGASAEIDLSGPDTTIISGHTGRSICDTMPVSNPEIRVDCTCRGLPDLQRTIAEEKSYLDAEAIDWQGIGNILGNCDTTAQGDVVIDYRVRVFVFDKS